MPSMYDLINGKYGSLNILSFETNWVFYQEKNGNVKCMPFKLWESCSVECLHPKIIFSIGKYEIIDQLQSVVRVSTVYYPVFSTELGSAGVFL